MEIGSVYNSGASFAERNPFTTPVSSYNKAYMAYGVNRIGREQESGNLSKLSAENEKHNGNKKLGKFRDGFKEEECQTCKERRYVDGSDDSGVSFQTPTKIPKASAMAAVRRRGRNLFMMIPLLEYGNKGAFLFSVRWRYSQ